MPHTLIDKLLKKRAGDSMENEITSMIRNLGGAESETSSPEVAETKPSKFNSAKNVSFFLPNSDAFAPESINEKDEKEIAYTIISFITTCLPCDKQKDSKGNFVTSWRKEYQGYTLNLSQNISERPLPWGMPARLLIDYLLSTSREYHTRNEPNPLRIIFDNVSSFAIKTGIHVPKDGSRNVPKSYRVRAIETLTSLSSSTFYMQQRKGDRIQEAPVNILDRIDIPDSSVEGGDPRVIIEINEKFFQLFLKHRGVYLKPVIQICGSSAQGWDIMQLINNRAHACKMFGKKYEDISIEDLKGSMGVPADCINKTLIQQVKRRIQALKKNWEKEFKDTPFPAEFLAKEKVLRISGVWLTPDKFRSKVEGMNILPQ